VKACVMEFFNEKREETKREIINLLGSKFKCSITVDEWTDPRMRRFFNVTIHSATKQFVLGLVLIEGSCTSEKTSELVRQRLFEFGVKLDTDVVASTHDGASVMVKYGRIIEVESQLCYNHAIHLAVLKVLYKSNNNMDVLLPDVDDSGDVEYDDTDKDDDEEESEWEEYFAEGDSNRDRTYPVFRQNIKESLNKMRRIIKFFKRSAIRTEVLNKHVVMIEGKALKLLLDCKTRWNTLGAAVNRFLKLKSCVNKALEELGATENFSDENTNVLAEVDHVLGPLMLAITELSKENANLITAEGTLLFVFQKLKKVNSPLAIELLKTLEMEIDKRRNKEIISLLLFLHRGNYPKANEFFSYSSKNTIKLTATNLLNRLFPAEIIEEHSSLSESDEEVNDSLTPYDELKQCLNSFETSDKTSSTISVAKEFQIIEFGSNKKSDRMEQLYKALLTIKPTSTSCERVFSVAGNIISKLKTGFNPETLNALVFLKYHFINQINN
jgi:hAT family C-terminal dimerisation region